MGGQVTKKNNAESTAMEIEETENAGMIGKGIAFIPLTGPPLVMVMLLDEDCEKGEEDDDEDARDGGDGWSSSSQGGGGVYFCFILKMNYHLLEHGVLKMGQHSSNIVPRDWEKEME